MNSAVVLLCSHRKQGRTSKLLQALSNVGNTDIVPFSDVSFQPCIQCAQCSEGHCTMYRDDGLNDLIDKLKKAGGFIIISPLYAPIPSKLSAFLERLTSISYFSQTLRNEPMPLKMKHCSVIGYDSNGRNAGLETLIKSMIRPILTGYDGAGNSEQYKFVESGHIPITGNDNLDEYCCSILRNMNLIRSAENEGRAECNCA